MKCAVSEKKSASEQFSDLPLLALGSLLAKKDGAARRERTAEERNADRAAMFAALETLYNVKEDE